ncbi:MAG: hypothetical protein ACRCX7_10160 [Cetobacterium sp.]|uniref:hypothetical protein n=1 Tax=Cetobacterium sp. TaxID=2071632 RepID=UPI003F3336B1
MGYKQLLDNGLAISKGAYLIVKNDSTKRYNRNHYALKHMSMGGWNEIGTRENWEEFVEYVVSQTKDLFVGIK